MNVEAKSSGHPKGLYVLFATEMWERFNYYGMRAILILFMTKALLFDKAFASNLYGSYTSLVYLTPLIGGFVADRYWGNRKSIIVGGLLMALGEFLLFGCASIYQTMPGISTFLFFSGLGFMIAGNGFFKPNISSMVGQLYPEGDRRIDAAYTIFYMGINVGGALGPAICGALGESNDPSDFKWSFLAAGIAMLLSVVVFRWLKDYYIRRPDGTPLGMAPINEEGKPADKSMAPGLVYLSLLIFSGAMIGMLYLDTKVSYLTYLLIAAVLFIAFIIFNDKTLTVIEKKKIAVIFILAFFVVFFWSAFEQAGASLTFFADEQTNRELNWNIPSWSIIAITVALLALIARLIQKVNINLKNDPPSVRYVLSALLAAGGLYLVYWNVNYFLIEGNSSTVLKEVPASAFQSLNSIFVVTFAPLFAVLWLKMGKYEPSSPTKMAIGLFFLSLGYLWIAYGVNGVQPGTKVTMMFLIGMYALHTWGELCLSPIGLALVNKLAPAKFASLLMAVWFLANAAANKLAGVLSALYPDGGKTTVFLGYEMTNLYEFFMLFVVMSGVASGILFLITKQLQKLMNASN
ncbi:POT family proton-dependent oligopeptide transporter [Chitinophaga skermanii]|uniref:POT family proton-dependent oligopeptide transporter n=1 Tax=Chitinophaga skermanii TaxID=331697 RepID=A0A327QLA4_9BACT|nr:peptide MFS transporter [Chitinophaga skermanii]RAJ04123.1 POT family proton-dependent oligopeptide transporter [Chitinophaga skermanii]